MICTQCGGEMVQTDKDTMSGRVIREYECRKCGRSDWEDDGIALWQALHDAREQDAAEAGAHAAANAQHADAAPCRKQRSSLRQRVARLFGDKR